VINYRSILPIRWFSTNHRRACSCVILSYRKRTSAIHPCSKRKAGMAEEPTGRTTFPDSLGAFCQVMRWCDDAMLRYWWHQRDTNPRGCTIFWYGRRPREDRHHLGDWGCLQGLDTYGILIARIAPSISQLVSPPKCSQGTFPDRVIPSLWLSLRSHQNNHEQDPPMPNCLTCVSCNETAWIGQNTRYILKYYLCKEHLIFQRLLSIPCLVFSTQDPLSVWIQEGIG
jgi:hypothetical protein